MATEAEGQGGLRIDKLLWYLRLAKTRSVAQTMVETGHLRINGRRVERSHVKVACGNVLTVPIGTGVQVIEVLALPHRRGPAPEAQACYRRLDGTRPSTIAAACETKT